MLGGALPVVRFDQARRRFGLQFALAKKQPGNALVAFGKRFGELRGKVCQALFLVLKSKDFQEQVQPISFERPEQAVCPREGLANRIDFAPRAAGQGGGHIENRQTENRRRLETLPFRSGFGQKILNRRQNAIAFAAFGQREGKSAFAAKSAIDKFGSARNRAGVEAVCVPGAFGNSARIVVQIAPAGRPTDVVRQHTGRNIGGARGDLAQFADDGVVIVVSIEQIDIAGWSDGQGARAGLEQEPLAGLFDHFACAGARRGIDADVLRRGSAAKLQQPSRGQPAFDSNLADARRRQRREKRPQQPEKIDCGMQQQSLLSEFSNGRERRRTGGRKRVGHGAVVSIEKRLAAVFARGACGFFCIGFAVRGVNRKASNAAAKADGSQKKRGVWHANSARGISIRRNAVKMQEMAGISLSEPRPCTLWRW
ncbi:MAG: hypothetical protein BWZ10_01861 [candidate division BRC1 bacterium ADurb.BinA364]|nr:MAG: hypothetical protein BWZ10_01861 [candidate division BRC1 bacterium ADurb.BinA364]